MPEPTVSPWFPADDDLPPPPTYTAIARLRPEGPHDTWAEAIVVEVDVKALAECVPALVEALSELRAQTGRALFFRCGMESDLERENRELREQLEQMQRHRGAVRA